MRQTNISTQVTRIIVTTILCSFRFQREAGLLPAVPPADQRACFGPSCLSKFLRHPGAGSFVWSSTVGNQPCLLRQSQLVRLRDHVLRRHPYGVFRLEVARVAASLGTDVEED